MTIPAHCPAILQPCPEVVAAPTYNLQSSQAVYLNLSNFTANNAGDSITVQYCQDLKPLSVKAPLCVRLAVPNELPAPQVVLHPFADPHLATYGTVNFAFQVLYLPQGSTPFSGVVPGTRKSGTFLCDAASPCSVDVTDPNLGPNGNPSATTPTPQNTAVLPVTFANASNGCPKATFVNTESEFGLDALFSAAANVTCSGSSPVADSNVDIDGPSAVSAFSQGSAPLVFSDSVESPGQQASLQRVKGKYALIPIALSANVFGFQAVIQASAGYPDTSFKLTPAMAAGVYTNFFNNANLSDLAPCPGSTINRCPLMAELNNAPGFTNPQEYGSFVRGDSSSPTYAVFQWTCQAPRVPVMIKGHAITEPYTASQILQFQWSQNNLTYPSKCPSTLDRIPTFQSNAPNFATASTPAIQVSKLQSFVPLPQDTTANPSAGFAPMSWADARQFGLSIAALQNAAGNFVLPTVTSLDAAASALKKNSDGSYSYDYGSKNPGAYPMPDVWYAVVRTKPQASSQAAAAERALLTDLLSVSGGSKTSSLPTGYAPLPKAMYASSLASIAKDLTSVKTSPGGSGPGGGGSGGSGVGGGGSPGTPGPEPSVLPLSGSTGPAIGGTNAVAGTTPTTPTPSSPPGSPGTRRQPSPKLSGELASFSIAGRKGALLSVLFVLLFAACMLVGPGLLLKTRRKDGVTDGL